MPDLVPIGVPVTDLRPTQMTLGFREVEIKRRAWRDADIAGRTKMLRSHAVPAVIGPKGRHYIVDHHHFAKALLDEKAPLVAVYVIADLEDVDKDEFWSFLDNNSWCHAYDASGKRRDLSEIPKSLTDLTDDPFRSLVGELIRAGGLAKNARPFFEFTWADFLRRRIKLELVEKDFGTALVKALDLAKSMEAKNLPGWSGAEPSAD
ncbi:ParB-like protein [Acidisoma cladoniae]|jgi:hypothetical protein|uniref:ParB-like protein n=1 Tax=Acidisoma cladoniae TaxID=3040935 RepID=UPI0025503F32|nr:ParB-like protein [Acidisoma sp. PAMC 29798]